MKAPEKLYAHFGKHLGQFTATMVKTNVPGEQEYVSKEALVMWLEQTKNLWSETGASLAAMQTVQMVINKLNSDGD